MPKLNALLQEINGCRRCAESLPLGPRPVVQCSMQARIVVAGQAPGLKVHNTGIPFNDPSGNKLRAWMGIDRETFYDSAKINIVPMGFCYPGRDPRGGDLPPRPECRETWHDRLFATLPRPGLTLVIGRYAQDYHLAGGKSRSVTETVRAWRDFWPEIVPLPHPSPRNIGWFKRNPWFEDEVIPALRRRIAELLAYDIGLIASSESG